jgi:signal transduction histidine kinase
MTNLLENAIDFSRTGGTVALKLDTRRGWPTFAVIGTGEGMDESELPRIFERFYRVDRSRARAQGRTGLGLAICKAIVDAHGGTISDTSQRGVGSQFAVMLPPKG